MSGAAQRPGRACSASSLTFEPAARATSLNLSGNSSMISRVWVPMEPVEPSTEKRCGRRHQQSADVGRQAAVLGVKRRPLGPPCRQHRIGSTMCVREGRTFGSLRGSTSGAITRCGHAGGGAAPCLASARTTKCSRRPERAPLQPARAPELVSDCIFRLVLWTACAAAMRLLWRAE